MKLIFISKDPKVKELIEALSFENVHMLPEPSLLDDSKYDENLTLLFLDYDNDKESLDELNKSLVERSDVIRLIISETLSVEELKAHQASDVSAHGYIRKPLTDEIVMGVVEDFEFSEGLDFIDEEEPTNADATGQILVAVDKSISQDMGLELSDDILDKESEEDLSTSDGLSFNIPEEKIAGSDSDLSENDELDLSAEDGLDLSNEDGLDTSAEDGLDTSAEDGLDLSAEDGLDLSAEDGLDLSAEDGLDLSAEDGLDLSVEDGLDLSVEDGLDLSTEDGLDTSAENGLDQSTDDELDLATGEDLELSPDEEINLNFSSADDAALDLSDDSSGELELSNGSDEDINLSTEDSDSADFELGDDNDAGFELGTDESSAGPETSSQANDELDLSGEEDSLDVKSDAEVTADNIADDDSAINLDMVDDSKEAVNKPESTVEFQFSKPEGSEPKEAVKEEDDLSFDMEEEVETTNTDSQATPSFSLNDEFAEETKPTIIISSDTTDQLKKSTNFGLSSEDSTDEDGLSFNSTIKEEVIERPSDEHLIKNYAEDEMIRLQATIRQLREEREDLLEKIGGLETHSQLAQQDHLGQKAEVEELKIEVSILKKRQQNDLEEAKYLLRLSDEKRQILEEKSKNYQKEFERLSQKVRIDFNKVKQREKELESQLEMLVIDSESQVKTRDVKMLELKRKIDSLEFNMENVTIKEQKHRDDKLRLEDKMAKMMKTLRGSIEVLENDVEDERVFIEQQEDEL